MIGRRKVKGPCLVFGNRSIEAATTDDPNRIGFIYSEDVWFIPPGATAEITVGADNEPTTDATVRGIYTVAPERPSRGRSGG